MFVTPQTKGKPQVSGPEVALRDPLAGRDKAPARCSCLPQAASLFLIPGTARDRGKGTAMNDMLVNAEIEYRVNRIREDWRPIRARRLRRQEDRAGATWIG